MWEGAREEADRLKENLWKVSEGSYWKQPANTALILRMDLVEGNLSLEYQLVSSEQRNLLLGSLRNHLGGRRLMLTASQFVTQLKLLLTSSYVEM